MPLQPVDEALAQPPRVLHGVVGAAREALGVADVVRIFGRPPPARRAASRAGIAGEDLPTDRDLALAMLVVATRARHIDEQENRRRVAHFGISMQASWVKPLLRDARVRDGCELLSAPALEVAFDKPLRAMAVMIRDLAVRAEDAYELVASAGAEDRSGSRDEVIALVRAVAAWSAA